MALCTRRRVDLGSPRPWAIHLVDSGPSVRHRTGLRPSFLWFKGTRFPRPDRPSPIALGVVRDDRPAECKAIGCCRMTLRYGTTRAEDASLCVARERDRLMSSAARTPSEFSMCRPRRDLALRYAECSAPAPSTAHPSKPNRRSEFKTG